MCKITIAISTDSEPISIDSEGSCIEIYAVSTEIIAIREEILVFYPEISFFRPEKIMGRIKTGADWQIIFPDHKEKIVERSEFHFLLTESSELRVEIFAISIDSDAISTDSVNVRIVFFLYLQEN